MAESKEAAQSAYDAAIERCHAANKDAIAAKKELDEFLLEEEAERRAVFMSNNPYHHPERKNVEVTVEEAKQQILDKRARKQAVHDQINREARGG